MIKGRDLWWEDEQYVRGEFCVYFVQLRIALLFQLHSNMLILALALGNILSN
jgi:hypothetical protein